MRSRRSKLTKRLTLSAMLVALGTVFMIIGAFVEVLDLSVCALVSMLMVFAYIEIGSPYTWLIWLATSLLTFILYSGSTMWMLYLLIFGIYPLLKGYIERMRRPLWLLPKLIFGNLSFLAAGALTVFLFGLPIIDVEELPFIPPTVAYAAFWLLVNFAFLLYDYFLTAMARFYIVKLRHRFKNLLD